MPSPFIHAWRYRLKVFQENVVTANFWLRVVGILGVLLLWLFLFYLAVIFLDSNFNMHRVFCWTEEERNMRVLAIVLLTPFFFVGLVGVIAEWLAVLDHRRRKRKYSYKPLVWFSVLLQVTALFVLIAFRC